MMPVIYIKGKQRGTTKMKKLLCFMLAMILVVSLASCGVISNGEIKKPAYVSGDTSKDDNDSGNDNDEAEDKTHSSNNGSSEESGSKEISIDETVVDEAGVKITAKSLSMDELFGPELKLLIENNSGTDLTFQCGYSCVNGYMIGHMMSVDIADGKKANDGITLSESDLDTCGISEIADIELSFHIFNLDDWETYLDTDLIKIKTSISDGYEYKFDDSGDVAYDKDNIKIVVKGLIEDSILGPSVVVYIENDNDENITVQARNVSVNGFMVTELFSCDVLAGKRAVDTITFLSSELEENEITAIENIELSFHIFDADSWDGIADSDTIIITF